MARFTRGKDGRLYNGKGTEGGRASDPSDNFPIGREEPELPYLPENDDSESESPVKATPKEEATFLAGISAATGMLPIIIFNSYIPAGGSLIIAGGVLVVCVAVTALALYKVVAYFIKHR